MEQDEMPDKETREALDGLIEEFISESDRAAVIIGAARIDELLAGIISKHLLPATVAQDEFVYGNGALSSFSARIEYCYRAGILSKEFRVALNTIRKLRNTFAHESQNCSLTEAPELNRVKDLVRAYKNRLFFTELISSRFNGDHSPSNEFRAVLAIHLHRLHTIRELVKRVSPDTTWKPLMPNWEGLRTRGIL